MLNNILNYLKNWRLFLICFSTGLNIFAYNRFKISHIKLKIYFQ